MNDLIPVPFHGDTLTLVDHQGQPFVAMRPIVEALGLAWQTQHRKIMDRFASVVTTMVTVAEDGKQRSMTCLPLRKLAGWLMGIYPNKVRADLRDKILAYQAECDDALWDYWTQGHATRCAVAAPPPSPPVADHLPQLHLTEHLGETYVVLRHLVLGFSQDWGRRLKELRAHYGDTLKQLPLPASDGRACVMTCLPLRLLPEWLATLQQPSRSG